MIGRSAMFRSAAGTGAEVLAVITLGSGPG